MFHIITKQGLIHVDSRGYSVWATTGRLQHNQRSSILILTHLYSKWWRWMGRLMWDAAIGCGGIGFRKFIVIVRIIMWMLSVSDRVMKEQGNMIMGAPISMKNEISTVAVKQRKNYFSDPACFSLPPLVIVERGEEGVKRVKTRARYFIDKSGYFQCYWKRASHQKVREQALVHRYTVW